MICGLTEEAIIDLLCMWFYHQLFSQTNNYIQRSHIW